MLRPAVEKIINIIIGSRMRPEVYSHFSFTSRRCYDTPSNYSQFTFIREAMLQSVQHLPLTYVLVKVNSKPIKSFPHIPS